MVFRTKDVFSFVMVGCLVVWYLFSADYTSRDVTVTGQVVNITYKQAPPTTFKIPFTNIDFSFLHRKYEYLTVKFLDENKIEHEFESSYNTSRGRSLKIMKTGDYINIDYQKGRPETAQLSVFSIKINASYSAIIVSLFILALFVFCVFFILSY